MNSLLIHSRSIIVKKTASCVSYIIPVVLPFENTINYSRHTLNVNISESLGGEFTITIPIQSNNESNVCSKKLDYSIKDLE